MITVSDAQEFVLARAGDDCSIWIGNHVDLVADTELAGEVEAGLDGEAGVGQDEALVVSFEVVEVGSAAVEFGADVVAGAMGEEVGETGGTDDVAGGVVCLPAYDGRVGGERLLDGRDGGVASVADDVEDGVFAFGGSAIEDGGPSDVVPDCGGIVG